jgi:hypothetical protein
MLRNVTLKSASGEEQEARAWTERRDFNRQKQNKKGKQKQGPEVEINY